MIKMHLKGVDETFKELEKEQQKIISKELDTVTDTMVKELREATPVDTGHARDSWSKQKKSANLISIKNDASYIKRLNAGSSKQAPSYFIEDVVLKHAKPKGFIVEDDD